jgi:hypothetical protein
MPCIRNVAAVSSAVRKRTSDIIGVMVHIYGSKEVRHNDVIYVQTNSVLSLSAPLLWPAAECRVVM